MTLLKLTGASAVLFLTAIIPANAQKDGKEEPQGHPAPPQQHAQPAKPPESQRAQAAKAASPTQAPPANAELHRSQPNDSLKSGQAAPQPKASPQGRLVTTPANQAQQRTPRAKTPAHVPEQHAQEMKTPTQQSAQRAQAGRQQPVHTQQQVQSWQEKRGWASQGSWQPHTNFQQGHDQNWASDHRDWGQRGGYGGFYIPQTSFGLYFGSSHFFHIGIMPAMYMGYPRFRYGGFAFLMVDPWPGSWQENWYTSDDVYIDYDGGYYLHDRRYPGVRLAVTVAI